MPAVGMMGAVRVKHEEYMGNTSAKVAFCLSRANQEKLPMWKNVGTAQTASPFVDQSTVGIDDLPFDM